MIKAFFGGSFNPPHMGHVLSVDAALSTTDIDQVIITPSGNHPVKNNEVSFEHRFEMIKKAFSHFDGNNVIFSDIENKFDKKAYTVDVIDKVNPTPNSFLCGSDVICDLADGNWEGTSEFLSKINNIYYILRDKYQLSIMSDNYINLKNNFNGDINQVYMPVDSSISSTIVRARLRNSQQNLDPMTYLTPKSVLDYISEHNLYRG